MELPKVILLNGKEKSLERKHPWVFSGAINKIIVDGDDLSISDGQLVEVYSKQKKFLGTGHFQDGTIAVRIISFDKETIDSSFWKKKLTNAYQLRTTVALTQDSTTNMYRLVHAEGDGLPGLIIDYYNGTIVIQTHSIGMHIAKQEIVNALQSIYGDQLIAIYDKSAETMAKQTDLTINNTYLFQRDGVSPNVIGLENNCKFNLDWIGGQKTGFFLDQCSEQNSIKYLLLFWRFFHLSFKSWGKRGAFSR